MQGGRDRQALANSLWSMFTGDVPYKKILKDLLAPGVQIRLIREAWRSMIRTDSAWERYAGRTTERNGKKNYGKYEENEL